MILGSKLKVKSLSLMILMSLFLLLMTSGVNALLNDSVAYYSFDETTNPSIYGGTPIGIAGKLDGAIDFDGSTDYIETNVQTGLEGQSEQSINFWINPDDIGGTTRGYIFDSSTSGTSDYKTIIHTSGVTYINLFGSNDANRGYFTTANYLTLGTWSNVQIVFNGSASGNSERLKVYIDGVAVSMSYDGTIPATTDADLDNLIIGYNTDKNSYPLNGQLDEFTIYNSALTSSQRTALYQSGTPTIPADEVVTDPVYYNSMDGLYDLSGNSNFATNNGATQTDNATGKLNSAFDFQTSDYINTDLNGDITDYTISSWVYLDDAPADDDVIFGSNNGATDRTRIRIQSGGNLNFLELRNSQTINEVYSFTDCYATWCHVVVTSEQNGRAIVYVNGTAVINVSTSNNDLSLGTADIFIGALNNAGPQDYWDGKIDEFSYYNRAWSSTEVLISFNSEDGFNPYTPIVSANFTITAQDQDLNPLTGFTADITGNSYYTDGGTGTITTDILQNSTSTWTMTINKTGYIPVTYTNYNVSSNLLANLTLINVTINLEYPLNDTYNSTQTQNFTFNVTSNANITSCSLLIDDVVNKTENITIYSYSNSYGGDQCLTDYLNLGNAYDKDFNTFMSGDSSHSGGDTCYIYQNYTSNSIFDKSIRFKGYIQNDTQAVIRQIKLALYNYTSGSWVNIASGSKGSGTLCSGELCSNFDKSFEISNDFIDSNGEIRQRTYLYSNGDSARVVKYNEAYIYNTNTNFTSYINQTLPEGNYNWSIQCTDIYDNVFNADYNYTLTIDSTDPQIITNFVNLSSYLYTLTGQFNFSDDNLFTINISDDVSGTIFNISNLTGTTYNYSLSHNVTGYPTGSHTLTVRVADGHTANKIDDYKVKKDWLNNGLKYEFDDGWVSVNPEGLTGRMDTIKRLDRYTFEYEKGWFEDLTSKRFYVRSSHPIIIRNPSKYKGHLIIPALNKWIDFEEIDGAIAKIERVSDTEVIINVQPNKKDKDKLTFNSIGDLNVVTQNFTFFTINATQTYEPVIFEDFDTDYILEIYGDFTVITPSVTLTLNGTNYTPSLIFGSNTTYKKYSYTYTVNEGVANVTTDWNFNWTIELTTNETTNTTGQKIYNPLFGTCTAPRNYEVLNISYYNEIGGASISVTNSYVLNVTDGTYYYNTADSFTADTTHSFCTNINPSDITYNWDVYGSFTLNKTGYVTRVMDIDASLPITTSNNPIYYQKFYMIETNASTTVNVNWLSTDYQLVDGTMLVYKCNPNGTKSLVESSPIIAGNSYANIQLLLQTYSYEAIVEGNLYSNEDSYSKCHVEYVDSVTYYINLNPGTTDELIGLTGISCTLEEVANHTIQMTWEANPENGDYVSGCIKGYRHTIHGLTEVYNNCSSESEGYSRIVTVPVSNVYTVAGSLVQGGYEIACGEPIVIDYSTAPGGAFGTDALFGIILLVVALALVYAGDGETMLFGAGIGIVVTWVLGILMFGSIVVVTSIVLFLVMLALIGRYTRK